VTDSIGGTATATIMVKANTPDGGIVVAVDGGTPPTDDSGAQPNTDGGESAATTVGDPSGDTGIAKQGHGGGCTLGGDPSRAHDLSLAYLLIAFAVWRWRARMEGET
jgi:hypothetical protein